MKRKSREMDDEEEGFELPKSSSGLCRCRERDLDVGRAGVWQQGQGWLGAAVGPVGCEEPALWGAVWVQAHTVPLPALLN